MSRSSLFHFTLGQRLSGVLDAHVPRVMLRTRILPGPGLLSSCGHLATGRWTVQRSLGSLLALMSKEGSTELMLVIELKCYQFPTDCLMNSNLTWLISCYSY